MKKVLFSFGCIAFLAGSITLAQSVVYSSQSSDVVVPTINGSSQKNTSVVIQSNNGRSQKNTSVVIQRDDGTSHKSSDLIIEPDDIVVETDDFEDINDNDMNSYSAFSSQRSSSGDSFNFQHSSLKLSAANLNRPHVLSINTSGAQMTGEISVNGKVVKQINNNSKVDIDLSRYLSVGEHTVEVSARYAPVSSSVSVELSGPGTNVAQQNSGNGVLNYTMNVSVR